MATVRPVYWSTTPEVCPQRWEHVPDQQSAPCPPQDASSHNDGLETEIENARELLTLEADWDGEGSPKYSAEMFDRVVKFLHMHADNLSRDYDLVMPVPRIGPGPEGSIDLHWKQEGWELLVNIPAGVGQLATFYGDNYGTQKIRGSLDPTVFNLGIVPWLMN
jgi:hypothetical protein